MQIMRDADTKRGQEKEEGGGVRLAKLRSFLEGGCGRREEVRIGEAVLTRR
jgi:hypothetical protein